MFSHINMITSSTKIIKKKKKGKNIQCTSCIRKKKKV